MKYRRLFWVLPAAAFCVVAMVIAAAWVRNGPAGNAALTGSQPARDQPDYDSVEGRYLFSGTVFWGRYIDDWSRASPLGYGYPFSGLNSFAPNDYDAWVADLECPITTATMTSVEQEALLTFNCRPEFLPEAARYFDILNLANNHTDNQGPSGFDATKKALDQAGVEYFGHYDPAVSSDICKVIRLPIRLTGRASTTQSAALPVAFCALHYFYRRPVAGEVETIGAYSKRMPTFAFVHMGVEYTSSADGVQREIAHLIADQDPLFVVANNPHWVQDTEEYNGIPIVYSTGNFIFDQQYGEEVTRSASLELKLSAPYDDLIADWVQLANTCSGEQAGCLMAIDAAKLPLPQLRAQYEVVIGSNTAKVTTKANTTVTSQVLDRLNWQQTSTLLSQVSR